LSREDLPEQHVSARQRDSEDSGLGAADVDADGYAPALSPAHGRTASLLPPGARVVVGHGGGGVEGVTEVQGAELTGDRNGPAGDWTAAPRTSMMWTSCPRSTAGELPVASASTASRRPSVQFQV